MQYLQVASLGLLGLAASVAVWALVRLMLKRRDQLIEQVRAEVKREKESKAAERKQAGRGLRGL